MVILFCFPICNLCEFYLLCFLANNWYCQKSLSLKKKKSLFLNLKNSLFRKLTLKAKLSSYWKGQQIHSVAVKVRRKILCICFSGSELLAALTEVPWLNTTVRRFLRGRNGRWFLVSSEALQSHTNNLNDGCSLISSTWYGVQMFHMLQRLLWVSPVSQT